MRLNSIKNPGYVSVFSTTNRQMDLKLLGRSKVLRYNLLNVFIMEVNCNPGSRKFVIRSDFKI